MTVGAVVNDKAFTDWTADDLIALSYYDGAGSELYSGSDVYHAYDGYDSSRDLVAFYAHDGGAASAGGDGNFYFRVDLNDLLAYAEQGYLDIYVAINVGKAGQRRAPPAGPDRYLDKHGLAGGRGLLSDQSWARFTWTPISLHNTTGFGQDFEQFDLRRGGARPDDRQRFQESHITIRTSTQWNSPSAVEHCSMLVGTARMHR